jgi:hypothetical protein
MMLRVRTNLGSRHYSWMHHFSWTRLRLQTYFDSSLAFLQTNLDFRQALVVVVVVRRN